MLTLFGSATVIREGHVASFTAVGAIVETICAQPDFVLPFADGAVLFADALMFRFVASRAENGTGHGGLPENCIVAGREAARLV
jgi:hypothetical protein